MSGPKVVVIGAGSYFFGRPVIHKMATSPVMAGGELALVDTNPAVLKTMSRLARRVCDQTKCKVKVSASANRRDVMKGADFIVLTFSERNAYYRGVDTQIATRHGIRMCSSDTIGPGGIFRALREVPHVLAVASDARRLAPEAWIINFVNPTTVLGMALRRYAPDMRSFALCDGHHEPHWSLNFCKMLGIVPQDAKTIAPDVRNRLELVVGGVNHFTWVLRLRYDGKDLTPILKRKIEEKVREEKKKPHPDSKARYNDAYALELFNVFGIFPDCIGHTKEYVPYFQGYVVKPVKPEPIALFDGEARQRAMDAQMAETARYASGKLSAKQFLEKIHDDHATDIIEAMWGGLGKAFFINSANRGAIPNLPPEAFVELRCDVDMKGPRPQPACMMPRGVLGLTHQVLDTHELTAEAAATGDRALLRRAMLTDPICNNIPDTDACIADLLKAEREVLPKYWYR
ncbi:MAG: glycoside hydrolase family 4 [Candidatus Sumerlaeota bacterium]|nr:glycoside hydrolase family 4 [Candidatus Sumerlaeota bacterium]